MLKYNFSKCFILLCKGKVGGRKRSYPALCPTTTSGDRMRREAILKLRPQIPITSHPTTVSTTLSTTPSSTMAACIFCKIIKGTI